MIRLRALWVAAALTLPVATVTTAPAAAHEPYNWSGLYVGGGAGWRSNDIDWRFLTPANSTQSADFSTDDFILSGHVGYQKQFGVFVVGAELGVTGRPFDSMGRKSASCSFPAPFDDRCDVNNVHPTYTAGLRLGWTPHSSWMLFVTGGYAQASIDTGIRFGGVGVPPPPNAVPVTTSGVRHDGWYIGGGVEYALTANWLVGLEYQHVELNDKGHCVGGDCTVASILNCNVDLTSEVVRARISYKFNLGN